jgi:hypothetical protein
MRDYETVLLVVGSAPGKSRVAAVAGENERRVMDGSSNAPASCSGHGDYVGQLMKLVQGARLLPEGALTVDSDLQ